MIKELTLQDLVLIEKDAKFPIENINLSNCLIKKSIFDNDNREFKGIFLAHKTLEISIILRSDLSNYSKAKAINCIFKNLIADIPALGYDDSHIFLNNDDTYGELLKKHFGFEDIVGTPLVIRNRRR